MKLSLTLTALVFALASTAQAAVVEFHVRAGTGEKSWNTASDSIRAKLGDTIRIINDDTIDHRLHTNGAPCPHGPLMKAEGGSYDCVVTKPFSAKASGPLYDHIVGPSSQVWIEIEQ